MVLNSQKSTGADIPFGTIIGSGPGALTQIMMVKWGQRVRTSAQSQLPQAHHAIMTAPSLNRRCIAKICTSAAISLNPA